MIQQKEIKLPAFNRGFHLITSYIVKELPDLPDSGLLHLFIKHTSAAITINENADPTVRLDLETAFHKLVPEHHHYLHSDEGDDDMPAHIKASIVGSSLTIPVSEGKLNLGTWQGIYLCEFRNHAGNRKIVITLFS
jgi:secondary thiamine-phosphate synthase enzyme